MTLAGRIINATTGKPMTDALVMLNTQDPAKTGSDRTTVQVRTTAAGDFTVSNLEANPYYLTVLGTEPDGSQISHKADGSFQYDKVGPTPTVQAGQTTVREIRVVSLH